MKKLGIFLYFKALELLVICGILSWIYLIVKYFKEIFKFLFWASLTWIVISLAIEAVYLVFRGIRYIVVVNMARTNFYIDYKLNPFSFKGLNLISEHREAYYDDYKYPLIKEHCGKGHNILIVIGEIITL